MDRNELNGEVVDALKSLNEIIMSENKIMEDQLSLSLLINRRIDILAEKITNNKESTLSKEEIALRMVEAWTGQMGAPASFETVLTNYDRALKHLSE